MLDSVSVLVNGEAWCLLQRGRVRDRMPLIPAFERRMSYCVRAGESLRALKVLLSLCLSLTTIAVKDSGELRYRMSFCTPILFLLPHNKVDSENIRNVKKVLP